MNAVRLIIIIVNCALAVGCQPTAGMNTGPFDDPRDAPRGELAITFPEGECALCDLYYNIRQSVVRIQAGRGIGAGVIVDDRGFVITNAHVVSGHTALLIETGSGLQTTGHVTFADPTLDLAIVALDSLDQPWQPVRLQNDFEPRVGADVYVIGHPVGLGWSISRGIISGYRLAGEVAALPMIQTDAAISPGNSGGPLVDQDGRVLGIVVSKLSGRAAENIAFVIPSSVVHSFLNERMPKPMPE